MSTDHDPTDTPRQKFNRGQQEVAVIIETDVNDDPDQALTRLEDIVTFVDTAGLDLEVGDTVLVKIIDFGPRSVQAIARQRLSD